MDNLMEEKKILFLSTYDKEGGATAWFMNLANTLWKANFNVEAVVKYRQTHLPYVRVLPRQKKPTVWQRLWNRLTSKPKPNDIYYDSKPEYAFFPSETEMSAVADVKDIVKVCTQKPDLIIAGLTFELANTNTLKQLHKLWNVPVYMTAFDANVYTGGCHVLWGCEQYMTDCSACSGIKNKARSGEVAESFATKVRNIKDANIGIMYASPWSLHNALQSACFKDAPKFDIGMCIDINLFTDKNRNIAKQVFDVPNDAKLLFTGSADVRDKRKGVKSFFDSLPILWDDMEPELREKVYILIAGRNTETLREQVSQLPPFHFVCIEFITDTRLLSLAYQAADVFVCPSIEDAGPMMVAEALACGTPVVGYPMGLMWDDSYVRNGETGYVVEMANSVQMAAALKNVLSLEDKAYAKMVAACRKVAKDKLSREAFVENFKQLSVC